MLFKKKKKAQRHLAGYFKRAMHPAKSQTGLRIRKKVLEKQKDPTHPAANF